MIKDEKYYELDETYNAVVIDGIDHVVSNDVFDLIWQLSEQRDAAMNVIGRQQKNIDKFYFTNRLN